MSNSWFTQVDELAPETESPRRVESAGGLLDDPAGLSESLRTERQRFQPLSSYRFADDTRTYADGRLTVRTVPPIVVDVRDFVRNENGDIRYTLASTGAVVTERNDGTRTVFDPASNTLFSYDAQLNLVGRTAGRPSDGFDGEPLAEEERQEQRAQEEERAEEERTPGQAAPVPPEVEQFRTLLARADRHAAGEGAATDAPLPVGAAAGDRLPNAAEMLAAMSAEMRNDLTGMINAARGPADRLALQYLNATSPRERAGALQQLQEMADARSRQLFAILRTVESLLQVNRDAANLSAAAQAGGPAAPERQQLVESIGRLLLNIRRQSAPGQLPGENNGPPSRLEQLVSTQLEALSRNGLASEVSQARQNAESETLRHRASAARNIALFLSPDSSSDGRSAAVFEIMQLARQYPNSQLNQVAENMRAVAPLMQIGPTTDNTVMAEQLRALKALADSGNSQADRLLRYFQPGQTDVIAALLSGEQGTSGSAANTIRQRMSNPQGAFQAAIAELRLRDALQSLSLNPAIGDLEAADARLRSNTETAPLIRDWQSRIRADLAIARITSGDPRLASTGLQDLTTEINRGDANASAALCRMLLSNANANSWLAMESTRTALADGPALTANQISSLTSERRTALSTQIIDVLQQRVSSGAELREFETSAIGLRLVEALGRSSERELATRLQDLLESAARTPTGTQNALNGVFAALEAARAANLPRESQIELLNLYRRIASSPENRHVDAETGRAFDTQVNSFIEQARSGDPTSIGILSLIADGLGNQNAHNNPPRFDRAGHRLSALEHHRSVRARAALAEIAASRPAEVVDAVTRSLQQPSGERSNRFRLSGLAAADLASIPEAARQILREGLASSSVSERQAAANGLLAFANRLNEADIQAMVRNPSAELAAELRQRVDHILTGTGVSLANRLTARLLQSPPEGSSATEKARLLSMISNLGGRFANAETTASLLQLAGQDGLRNLTTQARLDSAEREPEQAARNLQRQIGRTFLSIAENAADDTSRVRALTALANHNWGLSFRTDREIAAKLNAIGERFGVNPSVAALINRLRYDAPPLTLAGFFRDQNIGISDARLRELTDAATTRYGYERLEQAIRGLSAFNNSHPEVRRQLSQSARQLDPGQSINLRGRALDEQTFRALPQEIRRSINGDRSPANGSIIIVNNDVNLSAAAYNQLPEQARLVTRWPVINLKDQELSRSTFLALPESVRRAINGNNPPAEGAQVRVAGDVILDIGAYNSLQEPARRAIRFDGIEPICTLDAAMFRSLPEALRTRINGDRRVADDARVELPPGLRLSATEFDGLNDRARAAFLSASPLREPVQLMIGQRLDARTFNSLSPEARIRLSGSAEPLRESAQMRLTGQEVIPAALLNRLAPAMRERLTGTSDYAALSENVRTRAGAVLRAEEFNALPRTVREALVGQERLLRDGETALTMPAGESLPDLARAVIDGTTFDALPDMVQRYLTGSARDLAQGETLNLRGRNFSPEIFNQFPPQLRALLNRGSESTTTQTVRAGLDSIDAQQFNRLSPMVRRLLTGYGELARLNGFPGQLGAGETVDITGRSFSSEIFNNFPRELRTLLNGGTDRTLAAGETFRSSINTISAEDFNRLPERAKRLITGNPDDRPGSLRLPLEGLELPASIFNQMPASLRERISGSSDPIPEGRILRDLTRLAVAPESTAAISPEGLLRAMAAGTADQADSPYAFLFRGRGAVGALREQLAETERQIGVAREDLAAASATVLLYRDGLRTNVNQAIGARKVGDRIPEFVATLASLPDLTGLSRPVLQRQLEMVGRRLGINRNELHETQQSELIQLVRQAQAVEGERTNQLRALELRRDILAVGVEAQEHTRLMLAGDRRGADILALDMFRRYGTRLENLAPEIYRDITAPGAGGLFGRLHANGLYQLNELPALPAIGTTEGPRQALALLRALPQTREQRESQPAEPRLDAPAINRTLREHALTAIDYAPGMQELRDTANAINEHLRVFDTLAHATGTRHQVMIDEARRRGAEVREILQRFESNPTALRSVKELRDTLRSALNETGNNRITDRATRELLEERLRRTNHLLQMVDANERPSFDEQQLARMQSRFGELRRFLENNHSTRGAIQQAVASLRQQMSGNTFDQRVAESAAFVIGEPQWQEGDRRSIEAFGPLRPRQTHTQRLAELVAEYHQLGAEIANARQSTRQRLNGLFEILDSNDFTADTIVRWAQTDGAVMLGTIIATSVAAACPIVGLPLVAAVGVAAPHIIREAQRSLGITDEGSNIVDWYNGRQVQDIDGSRRRLDGFWDVTVPLAREYATSYGTMVLGELGPILGRAGASWLSRVPGLSQIIARENPAARGIREGAAALNQTGRTWSARAWEQFKETMRRLPSEFMEQVSFTAKDHALGLGVDQALHAVGSNLNTENEIGSAIRMIALGAFKHGCEVIRLRSRSGNHAGRPGEYEVRATTREQEAAFVRELELAGVGRRTENGIMITINGRSVELVLSSRTAAAEAPAQSGRTSTERSESRSRGSEIFEWMSAIEPPARRQELLELRESLARGEQARQELARLEALSSTRPEVRTANQQRIAELQRTVQGATQNFERLRNQPEAQRVQQQVQLLHVLGDPLLVRVVEMKAALEQIQQQRQQASTPQPQLEQRAQSMRAELDALMRSNGNADGLDRLAARVLERVRPLLEAQRSLSSLRATERVEAEVVRGRADAVQAEIRRLAGDADLRLLRTAFSAERGMLPSGEHMVPLGPNTGERVRVTVNEGATVSLDSVQSILANARRNGVVPTEIVFDSTTRLWGEASDAGVVRLRTGLTEQIMLQVFNHESGHLVEFRMDNGSPQARRVNEVWQQALSDTTVQSLHESARRRGEQVPETWQEYARQLRAAESWSGNARGHETAYRASRSEVIAEMFNLYQAEQAALAQGRSLTYEQLLANVTGGDAIRTEVLRNFERLYAHLRNNDFADLTLATRAVERYNHAERTAYGDRVNRLNETFQRGSNSPEFLDAARDASREQTTQARVALADMLFARNQRLATDFDPHSLDSEGRRLLQLYRLFAQEGYNPRTDRNLTGTYRDSLIAAHDQFQRLSQQIDALAQSRSSRMMVDLINQNFTTFIETRSPGLADDIRADYQSAMQRLRLDSANSSAAGLAERLGLTQNQVVADLFRIYLHKQNLIREGRTAQSFEQMAREVLGVERMRTLVQFEALFNRLDANAFSAFTRQTTAQYRAEPLSESRPRPVENQGNPLTTGRRILTEALASSGPHSEQAYTEGDGPGAEAHQRVSRALQSYVEQGLLNPARLEQLLRLSPSDLNTLVRMLDSAALRENATVRGTILDLNTNALQALLDLRVAQRTQGLEQGWLNRDVLDMLGRLEPRDRDRVKRILDNVAGQSLRPEHLLALASAQSRSAVYELARTNTLASAELLTLLGMENQTHVAALQRAHLTGMMSTQQLRSFLQLPAGLRSIAAEILKSEIPTSGRVANYDIQQLVRRATELNRFVELALTNHAQAVELASSRNSADIATMQILRQQAAQSPANRASAETLAQLFQLARRNEISPIAMEGYRQALASGLLTEASLRHILGQPVETRVAYEALLKNPRFADEAVGRGGLRRLLAANDSTAVVALAAMAPEVVHGLTDSHISADRLDLRPAPEASAPELIRRTRQILDALNQGDFVRAHTLINESSSHTAINSTAVPQRIRIAELADARSVQDFIERMRASNQITAGPNESSVRRAEVVVEMADGKSFRLCDAGHITDSNGRRPSTPAERAYIESIQRSEAGRALLRREVLAHFEERLAHGNQDTQGRVFVSRLMSEFMQSPEYRRMAETASTPEARRLMLYEVDVSAALFEAGMTRQQLDHLMSNAHPERRFFFEWLARTREQRRSAVEPPAPSGSPAPREILPETARMLSESQRAAVPSLEPAVREFFLTHPSLQPESRNFVRAAFEGISNHLRQVRAEFRAFETRYRERIGRNGESPLLTETEQAQLQRITDFLQDRMRRACRDAANTDLTPGQREDAQRAIREAVDQLLVSQDIGTARAANGPPSQAAEIRLYRMLQTAASAISPDLRVIRFGAGGADATGFDCIVVNTRTGQFLPFDAATYDKIGQGRYRDSAHRRNAVFHFTEAALRGDEPSLDNLNRQMQRRLATLDSSPFNLGEIGLPWQQALAPATLRRLGESDTATHGQAISRLRTGSQGRESVPTVNLDRTHETVVINHRNNQDCLVVRRLDLLMADLTGRMNRLGDNPSPETVSETRRLLDIAEQVLAERRSQLDRYIRDLRNRAEAFPASSSEQIDLAALAGNVQNGAMNYCVDQQTQVRNWRNVLNRR